jgi:phospholipid/cholesterol/gamma-HCH transport system substrate-binding protein
VGALVLAAVSVLVGLILLMSGSTGGLFAKKLMLRCYFKNAAALKEGAPVTLEGVTIGNVRRIRVVPSRNPSPVEVSMMVGREYIAGLHVDSTAAIAQAGVLGDSYVDIDSVNATGPAPENNAELRATGAPTIQDVITSSASSIDQIQTTLKKVNVLLDTVNSGRGTIGKLITDPALAQRVVTITANLQTITGAIADGKGTLGKLVIDDTLYQKANATVDKLNNIVAGLDAGQGTAGKLLKDDALYNNLNSTLANTNQLVGEINAGKGALGKIAKDPAFAQKLDDTVTNLNTLLKDINEGQGTLGQLAKNPALYNNVNATLTSTQDLLKAFRADPKKYLTIQLKLF